MTTSTRLKACLYSFTSPGGPMYPTRAVRHAAWDALDSLFPVSYISDLALLGYDFCCHLNIANLGVSGGSVSSAHHQSLLSTALSMVLAFILLELHGVLHKSCILFLAKSTIF